MASLTKWEIQWETLFTKEDIMYLDYPAVKVSTTDQYLALNLSLISTFPQFKN